ncbi:MAG TPA: hypothetical protein VFC61_02825 [Blastocatellia bacterium]|jgi:hypothetical protein|nr:hypothetical protein [Blastocatellia bacterium]
MSRLWGAVAALAAAVWLLPGAAAAFAQDPAPKVMREFRGVKLGMKADQVHAAAGKPESAAEGQEEYKLSEDDSMTVYFDEKKEVRAIRAFFTNPKNVPAWKEVVGDVEVTQNENGSKSARRVLGEEKFWVSMYQNKDGSVTTITISR